MLCLCFSQDTIQAAERASKYKEENRQILKESIEVAPYTAKIQRSSDPGMDRDRERSRDPTFPVRIPALASPSPKAGHTHPHVIQSEKSNYFTTLSNSVVNEPPRLYSSKELSSLYEKVSVGTPGVVAAMPSQGPLSLGSYSSKASLSKPPPLIKHQPEGGEGLAGKITEQLSQQVTLVQQQHQHHTGIDRIERRSPAISPSSSSTSSSSSSAPNYHHHHHHQHQQQQQHQHRAMPSLHRAPVFHPPTQLALERKEAAEREKEREKERERAGYGGRLSPPTLTPIQPVSLVAAGSKTSAEQQKPPTLLPELRDIKGHGNIAIVTSVASVTSGDAMTSSTDGWRAGEMIQERGGMYSGEKGVLRGKPQAAMASVIVRPSTCNKYDSTVISNKSGAVVQKELPQGRFYPSKLQGEYSRLGESIREPGAGRVIQPNSNLDDTCVQYKNTCETMCSMQGTMGASTTNSVCRTAVLASSAHAKQSKSGTATPELGYPVLARSEIAGHKTGIGSRVLSHSGPTEPQEGFSSRTTSPGGSLPPPSPAGTPQPSPSLTPTPSSVSGSSQPYSPSFVHLKKHKAALAAAQSRSNFSTAPTSITTGNPSLSVDSVHNSPPLLPSSQTSASLIDSSSSGSASGTTTSGKSSPLPNGQSSGSVSTNSGQPSNYHKLKKAWLTRHSEEDRNTTATTSSTSTKPEKLPSTTTSTNNTSNTTAMSEMIKPCTVNLSASTSSEVEMSKESGSKGERERQSDEKMGGAAAGGGGGEERKSAPSSRRGNKRSYESGSESGGDYSDASESKMEGRAKRQPKPTYKKKQNDMAKKKGDNEKEEDDMKPNGIFRSAREKTKLKLASSSKYKDINCNSDSLF